MDHLTAIQGILLFLHSDDHHPLLNLSLVLLLGLLFSIYLCVLYECCGCCSVCGVRCWFLISFLRTFCLFCVIIIEFVCKLPFTVNSLSLYSIIFSFSFYSLFCPDIVLTVSQSALFELFLF